MRRRDIHLNGLRAGLHRASQKGKKQNHRGPGSFQEESPRCSSKCSTEVYIEIAVGRRAVSLGMPFLCLTVTALTPGLGARMAGKLLGAIGSSDRTFNASLTALESHCLNRPRNGCKSSAQPLSWDEPEYPQRLREIYDPPPLPYVRGNIELLDRHPISVVVRDVRPPRGIKWQHVRQRIWPIAGWARFPARRIFRFAIASSRDVAGCGGRRRCAITGSLITARLAMEFGREVYSRAGKRDTTHQLWPNQLIKQGAKLVTGWEGVIEELPTSVRAERLPVETATSESAARRGEFGAGRTDLVQSFYKTGILPPGRASRTFWPDFLRSLGRPI
jgi:hypothetical protein